MGRSRGLTAVVVVGLIAAGGAAIPEAGAQVDPCTDDGAEGLDPACLPGGTVGQLHRQICDYQWIEGLCDDTLLMSPDYVPPADYEADTAGVPFRLMAGAVHEHSSYSDGDPDAVPRDYFRAGRTGHNNVGVDAPDSGVKLDFMWSSEHSDNTQIPITTSAECLTPADLLRCDHTTDTHHYWKWQATLRQAEEETTDTFTAMRGFEWTNDYFDHMNVYFSTHFRNVKIDGSYLSMDVMWDWLRRPVEEGGGADGLVTFNHPGGNPSLTPFDGSFFVNEILAQFPGGANWNDLAYVPDVDDRVVGIEVNGGDDLRWYVKALERGWHLGPVAAEDEHGRAWSSGDQGKTLVLTKGRSPHDYYHALENRRTIALREEVVGGVPGSRVTHPEILYYADRGADQGIDHPDATPLGGVAVGGGEHRLRLHATDLPAHASAVLISDATGGQETPVALGTADGTGAITVEHEVTAPPDGEHWYFVVICAAGETDCGSDGSHLVVTAPVWVGAG